MNVWWRVWAGFAYKFISRIIQGRYQMQDSWIERVTLIKLMLKFKVEWYDGPINGAFGDQCSSIVGLGETP